MRKFLILCLMVICTASYADIASTSYVDDIATTKQDTISDIATIRSGAGLGATAVQPSALSVVARSGSYNDLTNKPTIPTLPTGPNDGNKYTLVWDGKAGRFIFEEIPVLQCEFPMVDLGFKECVDYGLGGTPSWDNAQNTWSITFPYGTVSGVSRCAEDYDSYHCACQMTSPRKGENIMLIFREPFFTNNCSNKCAQQCAEALSWEKYHNFIPADVNVIYGVEMTKERCKILQRGDDILWTAYSFYDIPAGDCDND